MRDRDDEWRMVYTCWFNGYSPSGCEQETHLYRHYINAMYDFLNAPSLKTRRALEFVDKSLDSQPHRGHP